MLLQMRQTSSPRAWTVLSQVSSKYLLNIIPFKQRNSTRLHNKPVVRIKLNLEENYEMALSY